ncbi:hypothetical protein Rsub_10640 [Raphidocelis subcapitata]|uniref:Saposin B-type domain-containing protein n=1 Tax=Raphidocelis subcapitata TaxID=307507 RepID=A0A2V0PKW4_9CHLO|nr:hypothetical protein Rsub_10640 [Raphidocelis subcapitata]|eukprot:GBF97967.1 hypothetical protein Rsub_10640 [Raphidocelis subcapitata]
MRTLLIAALLAALAPLALASRAAPNDLCGTCKDAVRVMKDLMCDPGVEGDVEDWVIGNVCPATGNEKSCADVVTGIAPALFDWLRLGTDADAMCAEVGVCGASPLARFAAQQPAAPRRARSEGRNDMGCPLCMFVVGKVKDGLSDPVTREEIRDKTAAACATLPEGPMRDTCDAWGRQYEDSIFEYIDTTEPADLCAALGSCSVLTRLLARPPPPLSRGAVEAIATAGRGAAALRAGGPASNDNCDACKAVVTEMHSALANPELEAQVEQYAKAVCDSMGALADSCKERIDQYAPMAFGMILAYLQPDQVCRQMHFCPAPSAAEQLLMGVARLVSPERFGGVLLQGAPMAGYGGLRLPHAA